MEFNHPPIPVTTKGSALNMLALFATFVSPVFLRSPVVVMEAKVKCSNTNGPLPSPSWKLPYQDGLQHCCYAGLWHEELLHCADSAAKGACARSITPRYTVCYKVKTFLLMVTTCWAQMILCKVYFQTYQSTC